MPYRPLEEVDEQHAQSTEAFMANLFGVPALRQAQIDAGRSILRGRHTFLDVPTGGGKTMALYYALFYFWRPGEPQTNTTKMVFVVSPLVGLMESQAQELIEKGVPAVALHSKTEAIGEVYKNIARGAFRVVFIGPETANSDAFYRQVLEKAIPRNALVELAIDEGHAIVEWSDDTFRPEYKKLHVLLSRLPTGVPVLAASATLPTPIINDIQRVLGLPDSFVHVAVSNRKPNVALSVRVMRHAQDTYADLLTLFQPTATPENGPMDFPQTLVYVNGRQDAERIQDFFRQHHPTSMLAHAFVFYHRHISERVKVKISQGIQDGSLRCVIATDALGLGLNFTKVLRVVLWGAPRTLLSLVQKFGRCARRPQDAGHCILYLTAASYRKMVVAADLGDEESEGQREDAATESEMGTVPDDDESEYEVEVDAEVFVNREAVMDEDEPPQQKGKTKKRKTAFEIRDFRSLAAYVATRLCRRIPWDGYFENATKGPSLLPFATIECCDNCAPESSQFSVPVIKVPRSQRGRFPRNSQSNDKLETAVIARLVTWREEYTLQFYPQSFLITPKLILPNSVVNLLASRARYITTKEILIENIGWPYADRCSDSILAAMEEVLKDFPDPADVAKQATELAAADKLKQQDRQDRLQIIMQDCITSLEKLSRPAPGRNPEKTVQLCQPFQVLPRRNTWPDYYLIIKDPISIKNIGKLVRRKAYRTPEEYAADWERLFSNAEAFNKEDSQIYRDAGTLRVHFNATLDRELNWHGFTPLVRP